MSRHCIFLAINLLLLCTRYPCQAQKGNITDETFWTINESPIVEIDQDIYVTEQGSLTIQPGVQVEFTGPFSIFVRGSVVLNGTESDPIRVSNGFKAFVLMEEVVDASLQAQHVIFENNSGGAIMREWPSDLRLPSIQIRNCTFVNNEYAIRSYDVELTNSVIQGGRIGASLHRSQVINVTIRDMDEICLFAGTDSEVVWVNMENCGTIGLQIEGKALRSQITNASEGIVAVESGWGGSVMDAEVKDCTLQQISNIGLKYISLVENTIVQESPNAVGAIMEKGLLSKSIIVGNRIGVSTGALTGDTAETNIEDSYVCGNSQSQFDALEYLGTSNATRTYFGDTVAASEQERLGEILQALPFLATARGTLNYDVSDSTVQILFVPLEQADVLAQCALQSSPMPSPTMTPPPTIPDATTTSMPTSPPTATPTNSPTAFPTTSTTGSPTESLTLSSTSTPTDFSTTSTTGSSTEALLTLSPTSTLTAFPTTSTTGTSTEALTLSPTSIPSTTPTNSPTAFPTTSPTGAPTVSPTSPLSTDAPTTITPTTDSPTTVSPTTDAPTTATPTVDASTPSPTILQPSSIIVAPTPQPTPQQQKQAPLQAKCGSLASSSGRGGAAGQNKGCTRLGPEKRRRIRGL